MMSDQATRSDQLAFKTLMVAVLCTCPWIPCLASASHGAGLQQMQVLELELTDHGDSSHGVVRVTLLRSSKWINDMDATVGRGIFLELDEMGVSGPARVLAIAPCPPISNGPGRLVTATFQSTSNDVHEIELQDSSTSIRATAAHPLYSMDRGTWVRVDELREHERLKTAHAPGYRALASTKKLPTAHTVHNLEVTQEHNYWVAKQALLAHNTYAVAKRIGHVLAKTFFPKTHRARRVEWFARRLPHARYERLMAARQTPATNLVDVRSGDTLTVRGIPIVGHQTAGSIDMEFKVVVGFHRKAPRGQPFERAIHIDVISYELHWPGPAFDRVEDDIQVLIAEQLADQLRNQVRAREARTGLAYKKLTISVPGFPGARRHRRHWAHYGPQVSEFDLP